MLKDKEICEMSDDELGKLFRLLLLDDIPKLREDLMKELRLTKPDSLKHYLGKMEAGGWIIRKNRRKKNEVEICLTKRALGLLGNNNRDYFLYRLYCKDSIVYIGKTNNLRDRISQHKKDKDFDSYDYYIGNKSDVNIYELYYIDKIKPIYNKDCNVKSKSNLRLKELEFIKNEES
jgi:predicted GIY-YIG superfamily endonuclease